VARQVERDDAVGLTELGEGLAVEAERVWEGVEEEN